MKRLKAQIADVGRALADGGFVRFVWRTGTASLFWPDGCEWPMDGRSYHALLRNASLVSTETGNTEDGSLVIEWR